MKDRKQRFGLQVAKWLVTIVTTVPFALCWFIYYAEQMDSPFYNKGNWLVIALFVLVYALLAKVYDAYHISTSRISDMVNSQCLAALLADCVMYVVIWLLTRHVPNPLPGLVAAVTQVILVTVWAIAAHKWYFKTFPPKWSAIVVDKHYQIDRLIKEYGME